MMWNDEDLDNFMKIEFPQYYEIYKNYDKNIKRIDIARYFILYKYGGIYADMDYICFKNFYNLIPQNKVSISESPYPENEYIQNALMISPKNHPFWLKVIKKSQEKERIKSDIIIYSTGPVLLSDTYFENIDDVNVLDQDIYNPHISLPDNDKMICRHYGTKLWLKP